MRVLEIVSNDGEAGNIESICSPSVAVKKVIMESGHSKKVELYPLCSRPRQNSRACHRPEKLSAGSRVASSMAASILSTFSRAFFLAFSSSRPQPQLLFYLNIIVLIMGKNETRNLIRQAFGGNRFIEKLSNFKHARHQLGLR